MKITDLLNLLQLSDSSFPTGGFSHSGGIESALQHGFIKSKGDLSNLIIACLENAGSFNVPFVNEAHSKSDNVKNLVKLDNLYQASVSNHVAKRASAKQGKSLLDSALKVCRNDDIMVLQRRLQHYHYPVVYGAVYSIIGIDLPTTQAAFISSTLRTVTSGVVRLDILGVMEAQKLQFDLQHIIPGIIERNSTKMSSDAAVKFPVIDVIQNRHDILFSKMFYS